MPRHTWLGLTMWTATMALTPLAIARAEAIKLEHKFKEGDTYYIETTSNNKMTLDIAGIKNDTETESVMVSKYKVLKADKDATVIEQRIESVKNKISTNIPGAEKGMDALKGATFKLTINSRGEVTELEGYDEFIKKLGNDNDAKMIKSFMTKEALKATASDNFAFLPDKPVSKGDTWKRSQEVPLGPLGSFKGETTFSDKGPGKDGEEVAFEQSLTYAPPKGDDGGAPIKITKGELKADKASGTLVFDASKGRLVRSDSTMKMKGTLTIDAVGNTTTVNVEMQQTSKARVMDKSPLD